MTNEPAAENSAGFRPRRGRIWINSNPRNGPSALGYQHLPRGRQLRYRYHEQHRLTNEPWRFADFQRRHLARYLTAFKTPRELTKDKN